MTDSPASQDGNTVNDINSLLELPIRYWKQCLAAVIVVVAAAGGYALYGTYQKSQIAKAENELGAIVTAKSGAERLSALEALAKTAPAGARDGINLEIAKTAQDLGDYAKAAAAWQTVSQNAPAGMKTVATLGYAATLSKAGQNAKAVEALENLSVTAPKAFTSTVDQQLAVTAEAAGQWQKAVSAYERLKAGGHITNAAFIDTKISELKAKAEATAKKKS
ncbi:conserved hypothetical protein [Solidesulfovibrio fructosivorans JJ]]|uniref:Ancillary SecYEG translocon subunit/Cell division coordinator CpoB TPR domain-containing protein n=1 Tax=Solidesulfovibrio fructosivorans JJ] TaxID=596151 RepID=E1JW13_SOLFR|nr:tetratricopeptide repeat protein [Solidesulfovibrio fructosivorans]EFL51373.1 conserved hypothetical protein [Solidesulfovibrio fructosivorans JJ]]